MLTFLTGTYFPSKKEYIYKEICRLLKTGERVYLIVPEQASFDRDRDFLITYGEELSNLLTVTSFTHLSRDVLEENGLRVKPEADEAAKNVLMSLAVEDSAEHLDIFLRYGGKAALVKRLLSEYSEIKQQGLGTAELFNVSRSLSEGILRNKTLEMARVFSAYEALLTGRFSESSDNIRVMTEFLKEKKIFEGAYVFFDDFRGFTGAQIKLMEEIISQVKEGYVSVCAPDSVNAYDSGCFSHAVRNCRTLRNRLALRGVSCREEKIQSSHPVKELDALQKNLFMAEKDAFSDECSAVTVLCAADKYAECDLVAIKIRELLESGLRCRDICISERSGGYMNAMVGALKKYGIPVFKDKRVPMCEYPLIKMILSAVGVAAYGFSSDEIFSYIKTGIAGVSADECSRLENYIYIWQIDKDRWLKPFTGHPDGFGEEVTSSSEMRLAEINAIREKIICPLITLKSKLEKNNSALSCKAVYEFLCETDAAAEFLSYAGYLYENGNEESAIECSAVWDKTMQALDALYESTGERNVSPRRFAELLKIILSSSDVGRIPAGIDEIVIGRAGRTRHLEPEAVFVLGCNEGVFPAPAVSTGLFSSSEKRILSLNEFSLENIPENIYAEERMIAYSVLTRAGKKLFVSYSRASTEGATQEPSEIIGEIKAIFPRIETIDDRSVSSMEKIGSAVSFLEEYSLNYRENSVYSASLKKYALESELSHRTAAIEAAAEEKPFRIENTNTARSLFGKDMYISPSKVEVYHSCAFRYFCQYGMNLRKPSPADLDARINGLLIHHLLENILIKKTTEQLVALDDTALRVLIDEITEKFITDYMGGRQDKGVILNRSLDKTKETAFSILIRMIKEFSVSRFHTAAVELEISETGDVAPYRLPLSGGGSITVGGKVDRVDIMEDENKVYLRVVDYKTGGKDFRLSDVFDGLNMQMIIYLMCLWNNGRELYGDIIPAGILYVPANNSGEMLQRNASEDDVELQRLLNGRMNGMLLEDETVLRGMEKDCEGRFINAYIDDKGRMKGTFLSLRGFKALNEITDSILISMGESLHKGNISALPLIGTSSYQYTCVYCDFKDVCRRSDASARREPLALTHKQAAELLKGSEE